ncbi:NUDIX hydrolase [Rhizobium halophytocola]|uniref:8-oxo-dGTP pyrophosphatase MutT (NUDIX family) n=1 Tax=Rhizobium halophytocola TaxID=735519 RepID=A0ABS4DZ08_9HYPH|nr:NUDIX hydrolase [Rhizobium halophytocola]MBP1850926.1 8-oxo-dGTP pyrophosphatase MutT (NUDIX family) [Rhizobium halophytocola]
MDQMTPFSRLAAQNTVFEIASVDLRVDPGEHPFHEAQKAKAAGNWLREKAQKPAMFDGQVMLQRELVVDAAGVRATGHLVPYSTFLWWRRSAPATGFHLFGLPVVVSGDGAIIAIRMADHTANAGQVYCAAGSLDASDVVNGRCDLLGNMVREVREETGLDLAAAEDDGRLLASHAGRTLAIYRIFRFEASADDLLAAIEDHRLNAADQEISGAVAIRSADPDAHHYNVAMPPLLRWFFAGRG